MKTEDLLDRQHRTNEESMFIVCFTYINIRSRDYQRVERRPVLENGTIRIKERSPETRVRWREFRHPVHLLVAGGIQSLRSCQRGCQCLESCQRGCQCLESYQIGVQCLQRGESKPPDSIRRIFISSLTIQ